MGLYYKQICNSFCNRDGNAEFSQFSREVVFGELNVAEVTTFLTRCTFDRFCNTCNVISLLDLKKFYYTTLIV